MGALEELEVLAMVYQHQCAGPHSAHPSADPDPALVMRE